MVLDIADTIYVSQPDDDGGSDPCTVYYYNYFDFGCDGSGGRVYLY